LNIDLGVTTALVTFGGNDLVVVLAQLHAVLSPSIEVVLHVYSSTNTFLLAYGPVLVESFRAVDRWLVVTSRDRDVVGAAVSRDTALPLSTRARVVSSVGFDYVVLHQRVASPAVDSKVTVALGVERSTVVDCSKVHGQWLIATGCIVLALPAGSWVPSLTADEVASVAPSDGVLAALAHGVLCRAGAIGPPRVEVAIVGALGARSRLTLLKG
jgi:hypothetical protein